MLEIALDETQKGVLQKDIAVNQEISIKYLDYIIHALKVSGMIANAKGKKSGYVLTRNPSEITMFDIHNAFEPGICIVDCLSKDMNCLRGRKCAVRFFWNELNSIIIDYLKKTTLSDLIAEEHRRQKFNNMEIDELIIDLSRQNKVIEKKKILIVDNDPDLLHTFIEIIEKENFDIFSSVSTKDGLEKLKNEKPDIFVISIAENLSPEDYEILNLLKLNPEYESMPIIFLTVYLDGGEPRIVSEIKENHSFNRVFSIEKPIDPIAFFEIIQEFVYD